VAHAGDSHDVYEDGWGVSVRLWGADPCAQCPVRGTAMGSVRVGISLAKGTFEVPARYQCWAKDAAGGQTIAQAVRASFAHPRRDVPLPRLVRRMHQRADAIASTFSSRLASCRGPNVGQCPALAPSVAKAIVERDG
jgi:hypothetical protein